MAPSLDCAKPHTVSAVTIMGSLAFCLTGTLLHVTITVISENEFELDTLWQTCRVSSAWAPAAAGDCVPRSNFHCGNDRGLFVFARAVACISCSSLFLGAIIAIARRLVLPAASSSALSEFLENTRSIMYFLVISFVCCIICPAIMLPVLSFPICKNQAEAVTSPDGVNYGPGPFIFLIAAVIVAVTIWTEYEILSAQEKKLAKKKATDDEKERNKTKTETATTTTKSHCPDDEGESNNTSSKDHVVIIALDATENEKPSSSCVHDDDVVSQGTTLHEDSNLSSGLTGLSVHEDDEGNHDDEEEK